MTTNGSRDTNFTQLEAARSDRGDEFLTVAQAARILQISPVALRHRLRRAQRRVRGEVVADLGCAVGRRLGSSWRVQLRP